MNIHTLLVGCETSRQLSEQTAAEAPHSILTATRLPVPNSWDMGVNETHSLVDLQDGPDKAEIGKTEARPSSCQSETGIQ